MSYRIVTSPTFMRAGANIGGEKQPVNDGLRKMLEKRAREGWRKNEKEHFVVIPTLLTVYSTEFWLNVGQEAFKQGMGILLFGCLTDCAKPIDETQIRAELVHELAHDRVTFDYMACSWPSDKEGNGASGMGFFLTLADKGQIKIERIIRIAEDIGERLGGLRHLYVAGKEPLVLERYSPLS